MPRRVHLPPELTRTPFSTAQAAALGITHGRLRSDDLTRPFHGVRMSADLPPDPVSALAVRLSPSHYFSHWTAAQLIGLPIPAYAGPLHVTAVSPSKPPRLHGVTGHVSTRATHVTVRGLRVSTPVDTWIAMSTELSHRQLVVLGDALVRRKHPFATIEQLALAVASHRGKRGAVALAAAFARVRAKADSVKETHLRLDIVDFGIPEPEVNVEIRDSFGRQIAIADLAYREWKVIAEYDGDQHRTDDEQFFRDVDRLDDLAEERWRVIRFNKSHVSVARLLKLRRALLAAGWRP